MDERIIATDEQVADDWQYKLRPRRLAEYIGQDIMEMATESIDNDEKETKEKDEEVDVKDVQKEKKTRRRKTTKTA